VNGNIILDTTTNFDTIVIRQPTNITEGSSFQNDNIINLNELQVWVNDTNIMVNSGLTSFYVDFNDNDTIISSTAEGIYNNIIEEDSGTTSGSSSTIEVASIIKNIPLSAIEEILALVLYNRNIKVCLIEQ
jgi:hypothetical protein